MRRPKAFTLVELMITISVIAILTGTVMFALFSAQETAKAQRTRSLIAKLNAIIMGKYESYLTRRIPVAIVQANPASAAQQRVDTIRELMRLEMPDRWKDVWSDMDQKHAANPTMFPYPTASSIEKPAIALAYEQRYRAAATAAGVQLDAPSDAMQRYQGAECLYLIITLGQTDEIGGREHFSDRDVADVDGDGLKEFIDAWGRPIGFLRWPAGYLSELQPQDEPFQDQGNPANRRWDSGESYTDTNSNGKYDDYVDPFDPTQIYPTVANSDPDYPDATYAIYPLIYSAGPDGITDIETGYLIPLDYTVKRTATEGQNNPFIKLRDETVGSQTIAVRVGSPGDLPTTLLNGTDSPANKINNALDNITNHMQLTK